MADVIPMAAETRSRAGKGAARATRRFGRVPAVIYGAKKDPIMISLDPVDLRKRLQEPGFFSRVIEMKLGSHAERVLPRDVQLHPVTDVPLHVDFMRLAKGATIEVAIPVEFINEDESQGLKRGGVLNVVRYDVDLICPVDAIPEKLVADLSGLDIGDSVHISDIELPEGVVPSITDRDFTVATIAAPTVIEVETEEAEEGEEAEEEAEAEGESEGEGGSEDEG